MLTARTEAIDRMLIFGQRQLRTVRAEHETRYNGRRPHRSRQLRSQARAHVRSDIVDTAWD